MRWTLLLLVVAGALVPGAEAAGRFEWTSSDPVRFQGEATSTLEGGSFQVLAAEWAGSDVLRVADGVVRILEWNETILLDAPIRPLVEDPIEPANASYVLRDADVFATWDGEGRVVRGVMGPSSRLALTSAVASRGLPAWLTAPSEQSRGEVGSYPGAPEDVEWQWNSGDAFFGNETFGAVRAADTAPSAFPFERALLDVAGKGRVLVEGGNLTFTDADGVTRVERLGRWTVEDPVPLGGPRRAVHRRAIIEGSIDSASIVLDSRWGVAAASSTWTLVGSAKWTRASGTVEQDGTSRTFDGEPVEVTGSFDFDPTRRAAGLMGVAYAGTLDEGATVTIGGQALAAPPSRAAVSPVALSLGALALATVLLALKFLPAMYTRIAPNDLLENSRRRGIYERVVAQPGIHQRELHRAAGGAWGPFTFHMRLLREAGYLRVEEQGRYRLVFPASGGGSSVTIPHPVTRAVYDAMPADGSVISFTDLVARVGVSRQLLSYHLRTLESRGLAASIRMGVRGRGVRRVGQGETARVA